MPLGLEKGVEWFRENQQMLDAVFVIFLVVGFAFSLLFLLYWGLLGHPH